MDDQLGAGELGKYGIQGPVQSVSHPTGSQNGASPAELGLIKIR